MTEKMIDQAKAEVADFASDAKEYVANSAKVEAEATRDQVADKVENAANAASAASSEFDSGSLQAAALEQISDQIGAVAARFRDKPVEEMIDDVAVFARKNPLLFFGGAALVGFAAARFLKSGDGAASQNQHDPWSGHLNGAGSDQ